MARSENELERSMEALDAVDVLEVTARYGGWHLYDVRLDPVDDAETGSIELCFEKPKAVTTPPGGWRDTRTSVGT